MKVADQPNGKNLSVGRRTFLKSVPLFISGLILTNYNEVESVDPTIFNTEIAPHSSAIYWAIRDAKETKRWGLKTKLTKDSVINRNRVIKLGKAAKRTIDKIAPRHFQ